VGCVYYVWDGKILDPPISTYKEEEMETKRQFESGANRDTDAEKLDIEGFLHPIVLERYCEYLNKHRELPDGTIRESDNWQRGMPIKTYVKSALRHVLDVWCWHRGYPLVDRKLGKPLEIEDVICAVIFNFMGLLLEVIRIRERISIDEVQPEGGQEFKVGAPHPFEGDTEVEYPLNESRKK